MKREDIDLFVKIQSQLEELYNEISALSKKSQNDALNEFKLEFVNNLLEESNKILGEKYKPFKQFSKFDNDNIPTNSDVVMILSQYLSCLENLRSDNIVSEEYSPNWFWLIDGNSSGIQTKKPERIERR
ncbi:hypothetical protein FACS1894110_19030 [Spirochaetia bacterium]|nr:hypothetical protein FACS1894110_19030 [Spirochaetia bacterium]